MRKLAAIMFTDIVGYTALMGKNSEQALQLVQVNIDLQKPLVEKHHGTWLKEIGDGVLVQFDTALDAVQCAIAIQKAARAELDAKLRIGVHLGDVTIKDEDVFGDGVNIASRLEAMCDPGGVYISQSVDRAIKGNGIMVVDLGNHQLKNVDDPIQIFAIQGVGLPVPNKRNAIKSARNSKLIIAGLVTIIAIVILVFYPNLIKEESSDVDNPERQNRPIYDKSIAILPFENLSNDAEQEYFADGMAEMIRTQLSKLEELKVTSMRSVMQYKKSPKTIPQIGDELRVSYVLEGSVFRAGDRIRVNAQLIQTNIDDHLWAEYFEGSVDDMFDFQNQIAQEVSDALSVKLIVNETAVDTKVQELILQANHHINKLYEHQNSDYLNLAEDVFNRALDIEETNADVLAGLGRLAMLKADYGQGRNWIDTAHMYANKALVVDPLNSEANSIIGWYYLDINQLDKAEELLLITLDKDPNNSEAMSFLSSVYGVMGKNEERIKYGFNAMRLDPNNSNLGLNNLANMGWNFMMVGLDSIAEELFKQHLRQNPEDHFVHINLVWLYAERRDVNAMRDEIRQFNDKANLNAVDDLNTLDGYAFSNFQAGQYDMAKKMYERIYELTRDDFEELGSRHHVWRHRAAIILGKEGKLDSARILMDEHINYLLSSNALRANNIYDLAGAYAWLGDRESAYKWLEQMEYTDFITTLMQSDVLMDSLRGEPRFEALISEFNYKRSQSAATLENIIAGEEMRTLLK
ncbi:MAG: hypothetical protein JXQ90_04910 [Cyclobacteriaceae bacterium]